MNIEEANIPDGIDPEDVEFDDDRPEVVAYDTSVQYPQQEGRFNPQNGRRYRSYRQRSDDVFEFDSVSTTVGHTCRCAYTDCDGITTVEQSMELSSGRHTCPECGEGMMGREQFTRESENRRDRRAGIAQKTKVLRDDFAKEMSYLKSNGVSTVAAMDYMMCSVGEIPYEEWAEARGVQKKSVKQNISRVADTLGETVTYKTRGY